MVIIIVLLCIIIYFILNTNLSKPISNSESIKEKVIKPNSQVQVNLHPNLAYAKNSEEFIEKYICLEIGKFIKEVLNRIPDSSANKGKILIVGLYELKQDYIKMTPELSQDSNIPISTILTIINKCFNGIGLDKFYV